MKKAIIKVKLNKLDQFEKRVKEISLDLTPTTWQHDRVYVPRGYKRGLNLPRLVMRTELKAVNAPPKYRLILKRHIEDSGIEITNRTEVSDYTELVNIIHQLGFVLAAEVSRRRREIEISENTQFYLDSIDGLEEHYVKLETVLEDNDKIADVMKDLKRTLKLFKLSKEEISTESYFEMINKK